MMTPAARTVLISVLTLVVQSVALALCARAFPARHVDGASRPALRTSSCPRCASRRPDLAVDPPAQGSQQQDELDADLNAVLCHRRGPGRAGSLEVQRVALPGVRAAELVLQSIHQRLRDALGLRQSQVVVTTDDDAHCS